MSQLIGQALGRYKIERELAEDACIQTYKGIDVNLARDVTIQVVDLANDALAHTALTTAIDHFTTVARAAAQLDHPGLVRMLDFGQTSNHAGASDYLYLATDFVDGPSLAQLLQDMRIAEQWLTLAEAVYLVRRLCDVVAYTQAQTYELATRLTKHVKFKPIAYASTIDQALQPVVTNLNVAEKSMAEKDVGDASSDIIAAHGELADDHQNSTPTAEQALAPEQALALLLFELALGHPLSIAQERTQSTLRMQIDTLYADLPQPLADILIQTLATDAVDAIASVADLGSSLNRLPSTALSETVPPVAARGAISLQEQHAHSGVPVANPPVAPQEQLVPATANGANENDANVDALSAVAAVEPPVTDAVADAKAPDAPHQSADTDLRPLPEGNAEEESVQQQDEAVKHAIAEEVVAEDSAAEDAAAEDSVVEEAAVEEAAVEDSVAKHDVAEDAESEDVVAEDAVAKSNIAEDVALVPIQQPDIPPGVFAILQVQEPNGSIRTVEMKTHLIRIGRAEDNEIILVDPRSSRRHAHIEFDGTNYTIIDRRSLNGTLLDGVPLLAETPTPWSVGQQMRIGGHLIRIVATNQPPVETPEPAVSSEVSAPAMPEPALPQDNAPIYSDNAATRIISASATPGIMAQSLNRTVPPSDVQTSRDGTSAALFVHVEKAEADPGRALAIPIVLLNPGTQASNLTLSVEGIPPPWIQLDADAASLQPEEQQVVALRITAPRVPQSRAGHYKVTVRATNQADPEQVAQVAINLMVHQFADFRCDLQPQKVRVGEPMQLTIDNNGNRRQTFALFCWSGETDLTIEPTEAALTVEPGRTETITFTAKSQRRRWLGGRPKHKVTMQITPQDGHQEFCYAEVSTR